MSSHWNFIEQVAGRLGVTGEAFRKWRVRGVPLRYRLDIVDDAAREGFAFDRAAFDEPPGPKRYLSELSFPCRAVSPSILGKGTANDDQTNGQ
jgi:hypothetical protein